MLIHTINRSSNNIFVADHDNTKSWTEQNWRTPTEAELMKVLLEMVINQQDEIEDLKSEIVELRYNVNRYDQ